MRCRSPTKEVAGWKHASYTVLKLSKLFAQHPLARPNTLENMLRRSGSTIVSYESQQSQESL